MSKVKEVHTFCECMSNSESPLYKRPNPNASQLPTWNEVARYGSGSIPNHNGAETPVT
jgi:hypothetical protein